VHPARLYVVTRADLPAGTQACQAAHAAIDFTFEHPAVAAEWHRDSNTIAILAARNEPDLWSIRARHGDLAHTVFFEPDLDGQLTAIAFEPAAARRLRNLPLALNGARGGEHAHTH
jgi:hypothetical protein